MSNLTNPAVDLARKIQRGDLQPEEVDIERLVYDDDLHLTPELESQLTDDQLRDFERLQSQKIDERAQENVRQHSDDIQQAIDALKSPQGDTTEVPINEEQTIEVKTYFDERREELFQQGELSLSEDFDDVLEILEWVIEDEAYANPDVWREFKRQRGKLQFNEMFWLIVDPALSRYEEQAEVGNLQEADGDS